MKETLLAYFVAYILTPGICIIMGIKLSELIDFTYLSFNELMEAWKKYKELK